ncbi:EpsG family protein [Sphingobacterium kitahiroshimense]|uniref:EpsG family protein n=1 Tax=Sphingobacterium kitahiroshimense TaxID=470446 RepID=A0ABV0C419_9SPHI
MIYFLVLSLLMIAAFFYDYLYIKNGFRNLTYGFFLIIFIIVSGFRYKVGGDSIGYLRAFENDVPTLHNINFEFLFNYKWEPFFNLLMSISKTVSSDFSLFQIIHAIIVNVLLFSFFKKYTKNIFTTLIIYAFFSYLYLNTEILRESLAIAIFTLMYPEFENKSWKKYYIWAFIACGFHTSAFITLLFPLFRNILFTKKALYYLGLIFSVFFILNVMIPFDRLIGLLGQGIAVKLEYYSNVKMNINGTIFKFFFFVICPSVLVYYKPKLSFATTYSFSNILFLYFLLALIYVVISGFGRFLNYFLPVMSIYYADVIIGLIKKREVRAISIFTVPLVVLLAFGYKIRYYLESTSNIYQNTTKFSMYYPYTSVFIPGNPEFREILYDQGLRESYYNAINR